MADDTRTPPPPGMLIASLVLLAGAVVGAVMAFGHSSTMDLVLGIVIFACGAFLGLSFLYAWSKGRK